MNSNTGSTILDDALDSSGASEERSSWAMGNEGGRRSLHSRGGDG